MIKRYVLLGCLVVPVSVLAYRQTTWLALNATPAMGHTSSPPSQDVTKSTSTYEIKASVTDLDTFAANTELKNTAELAGNERDVSINSSISSSNLLATNRSFDPVSGKREETYVLQNNSYLADQGDVAHIIYNFQGVDNMTDPARHDVSTSVSQCVVNLKYVSPPAGPPKGGI